MKFCFVCGKKTDKLLEGYCEDCYNKKFNLIKIPEDLQILQCSKCKKLKDGILWTDKDVEDLIKKKIKLLGECTKIEVKGNKICVWGTLEKSKRPKEESHEINLKIVKVVCPNCSKRLGGYYETTLQIRGNATNAILNFLDEEINKKSYYRLEQIKGGFNLYVGDKDVAKKAAEFLSKKYKFKIRKTYRLFTKKDGRDVYKSIITIDCD